MKSLLNFIEDLLKWIFNAIKQLAVILFEKFLDINVFEKGIVINTATAIAAVVMPVAQYYIFEQYFLINNPIAHHMIGITAIMLVTVYFPGFISMIARVVLNLLYLAGIIYLQLAHEISKAPYEIMAGYYLNLIAPIIYIILALASGFMYRKN
jgi:hypothetical protein